MIETNKDVTVSFDSLFPESSRIIWICWFQGRAQMPPVVEKCVESWETKNPECRVILIDRENAGYYVPDVNSFLERQDISWTQKSDILRLHLLEKYGGVWCDATLFCNKPLCQWLPEYLSSGFFAFYKTGRYLLSSWFLVSTPPHKNHIISEWKHFIDKYFSIKFRLTQMPCVEKYSCASTPLGDKLTEWFDRNNIPTSVWFSLLIRRLLRISPYYCLHYAFEYLYKNDNQFKQIWDSTPKIHADAPLVFHKYGMSDENIDPVLWDEIKSKKCPVYKLTWKIDDNQINRIMDKLLEASK